MSVKGRELLVDRIEVAGWSPSTAAEAAGISDRTASKWLARYRAQGLAGLLSCTIAADHTAPSATRRPSLASTS